MQAAETLTVLICTHNRVDLLQRALASLNACTRPPMPVKILVAANACSDGTVAFLREYQAQRGERGWLPLDFLEEPAPGKSNALNTAIPRLESSLVAMVDDDHRVDSRYLESIAEAVATWPEVGLYCGRIWPDWDGTEPDWVHDEGPYKIYPLPVPRFDQGDESRMIAAETGPIPGGGNLVVRRWVFAQTGQFSTDLGPRGHDLGGGEDSEYVLRAFARGVTCRYAPAIIQYHYVDVERLKLSYLLKKSYQRTRSIARLDGDGSVPIYMWRKLAEYCFLGVVSLQWPKRRFYWMRLAAALGELRGRMESGYRKRRLELPRDASDVLLWTLVLLGAASAGILVVSAPVSALPSLGVLTALAGGGTLAILGKSVLDFSQTGPQLKQEILSHYRRYTLFALSRLAFWVLMILMFTGGLGMLVGSMLALTLQLEWSLAWAAVTSATGMVAAVTIQFARALRYNPGLLVASMHYRASRFYGLWAALTPARLRGALWLVAASAIMLGSIAVVELVAHDGWRATVPLLAAAMFSITVLLLAAWEPEAAPARRPSRRPTGRPNILMIGSDTLRADRLGAAGYRRSLTPNIDGLARDGANFSQCYVPCARTAASLISLFTGVWPHRHGIRDNFAALEESRLKFAALPTLLKPLGYRSAVVSDWCGADMGKFSFGFDHAEVPSDQWNLKYLIRQGPKDMRLFLSLFTHNRFGRHLLPELYYLGGVPSTSLLGSHARRRLSQLASDDHPFLLNVFFSTTHPPFASEWPWYTRYADPDYRGESKFAMARLTDPFEIIRRQGAPREEFDLDHIIDLYDGCVAQFDHEVGRLLSHLAASGLADDTIVVVYSDHGMEFFEHDAWGQGNSAVGEASPRVPLVIRDPRLPSRGNVPEVVRSIDLLPTLLELVGDDVTARDIDGLSLAGMLRDGGRISELEAFNETGVWFADVPGLPEDHLRYPILLDLLEVPDREHGTLGIKSEYIPLILQAKDRMVRKGRWKLVYQPLQQTHTLKLFDLEADPDCRRDVSSLHPDITKELSASLLHWIAGDDRRARPT